MSSTRVSTMNIQPRIDDGIPSSVRAWVNANEQAHG